MYTIRRAVPADVAGLVAICDQIHGAGVCTSVPISHTDFGTFATAMIESPIGAFFVAEKDGELAAVVGLLVVPFHWNFAVKLAQGVLLWVKPKHRGAGHKALIAAEEWARSQGAHKIMLTTNDTIDGADNSRSYFEGRGYVPEETNYMRSL